MPTILKKYLVDDAGFQIGVSNKTQNSIAVNCNKVFLKNLNEAYQYSNPHLPLVNGGLVFVSRPFVDKLAFTLPIPKDSQRSVDERLKALVKAGGAFSKASVSKGRYKSSVTWTDGASGRKALIQYRPYNKKNRYLRVELNPRKLKAKGMKSFWAMLLGQVLKGIHDAGDVKKKAVIGQIDFTVDIHNASPSRLIVSGDTANSGVVGGVPTWKKQLWLSSMGKIETAYLDKPETKAAHKKVYAKHQQRLDTKTKNSHPDLDRCRVEFTRKNETSFGGLEGLDNYFKKFAIIDPPLAPEGVEEGGWELFLDSCRLKGGQNALHIVKGPKRKIFEDALSKAQDMTWRPKVIWSYWKKYLKQSHILPTD